MKRLLKWTAVVVTLPFVLVALLVLLFYLPPVQDFVVRWLATYASEQTGYDIHVERLRITPLLDLDVKDLVVCDGEGDTLIAACGAVIDLDFSEVMDQRIGLEGLTLSDAVVNTKEMIASVVVNGRLQELKARDGIDLRSHRLALDEVTARGVDADVVLRDTTLEDTTTSEPVDWQICIARIAIDESHARLMLADSTVLELDSFALAADSMALDLGAEHLQVPKVMLRTPSSGIAAEVDMDFKAFVSGAGGTMDIDLHTTFSKGDILRLVRSYLPDGFAEAYPDKPLGVGISLNGNIDSVAFRHVDVTLPGSLLLDARGDMINLLDSAARQGSVSFNLQTEDIDWVRGLTGGSLDGIRLVPILLSGLADIDGPRYSVKSELREGEGLLMLDGYVDTAGQLDYDAKVKVSNVQLRHFLPHLATGTLTATATLSGTGTDLMSSSTRLEAHVGIEQLTYDHFDLRGTTLAAKVERGHGTAHLTADNALLVMAADVEAHFNRTIALTLAADISQADLLGLGIVDHPLKTSMKLHIGGSTDMKHEHRLEGEINDIVVMPYDSIFYPEDITLNALLLRDSTNVHITSGDLELRLRGHVGYDKLLTQLNHFTDELNRQITDRRFDLLALTQRLPQLDLRVTSGQENPLHDIAASMGYDFEALRIGLRLDPVTGINGGGRIYALHTGAILLDTIGLHAYQDSTNVRFDARIHNNKRNPQISFQARLNAYLNTDGLAGADILYYDDRGRKGVDLGLSAKFTEEGYLFHLDPLTPIIAFRNFRLNADNFVMLGKGNRVEANVDLLADDGTGVHLYSSPNDEALQDLTVSINHLNLGELMTVLPYAPRLGGFLQGDAHLIQTSEHLSVAADINVDELRYESADFGQVGVQAVYLPNADGSHFIDGSLLQTGMPVASFTGTYAPKGSEDHLDVDATLDRLPFSLLNGFLPNAVARLEGVAIGAVHVGGTTSKPLVDGELQTVGLKCISASYGLNLRFADSRMPITGSSLDFNQLKVYSTNDSPFTLDGSINFANLDRIRVDATMTAKDFELINAKKTTKSLAYGNAFVDFNANIQGTLDNLRVMGRLKLLGNTDLTYVLTDSPLTVEDQLDNLVEFVDFTDSTFVATEERAKPQHINLVMGIEIEEVAQLHCLLSPDGSSYIDLEGGGELLMTYSPEKDLQLNGRYTVNTGTIKYTMMVIPLKEFQIKSGSYVEFRGPILNPALNITATERMRTTVTENQQPRSVNFDVGLSLTQTLENLGLEFTLDAPEDLTIKGELNAMSKEQRGRLALTMLATGMYINDAGANTSGGVTGQNALNAFLQGQISNITSKALKSIDLSVGLEQGTGATGGTTTDYSFRFAKRFWGNRISVIVGGKVSTGEDAQNTGESIIDNLSIEYRLDNSATRYVNLFYDKNYESILDGQVTEMGAGLVLRRKTNKLGELFLFKKKSEE